MTNEQKQVTEFMALFGQEIKTKPEMPSEEIRLLRAKLIFEEAIETIHALGCDVHHSQRGVFLDSEIHATLTDIADGLADLHYVAYCGTAAACGINMEPVFAEVHQSNMTKLWTDAEYTCYDFNIPLTFELAKPLNPTNPHKRCYIARNKDGKVIKSPSYSPANIKPILDAQSGITT
jgi:predicted HAD superfamily Cof-like phosphohydrolase